MNFFLIEKFFVCLEYLNNSSWFKNVVFFLPAGFIGDTIVRDETLGLDLFDWGVGSGVGVLVGGVVYLKRNQSKHIENRQINHLYVKPALPER